MAVRRDIMLVAAALALAAAPVAMLAQPRGPTPQRHGGMPKQKTIEIEDFSFDIEQVIDVGSQGKADREGKVRFNPFHITRAPDQASPRFLQAAAAGESFETIVLDTMRHGKRVKVRLHDVKVSGYQRNGGVERFTLTPRSGAIVG